MEVEFVGAAQTVTGSRHVVRTRAANILLDCGLYQGRRAESVEQNRSLGVDPHEVSSVVLSHAHIDHSGALPVLVRRGFDGPIYCTPATRDLCSAMLADSAQIQQSDARFINKLIDRGQSDMQRVEPLYGPVDVLATLRQMVGVPYHRRLAIAPGVTLTFFDAGHVLGSAVTVLDVDEGEGPRRLVFTGDLGRKGMPILREPECPPGAQTLLVESTYGDRLHPPIAEMNEKLADVVLRTHKRGGKLIVPSFALERAQEIVFALKQLRTRGRLPKMPVYVDSPLTVKITDVFRLHPECLGDEMRALVLGDASPFDFEELRYVSSQEDSKRIDAEAGPAVVISASGMCEAGRVLHHLKATIEDPKNTVAIVGFQAQHTLGRRLVEHRPKARIFGVERDVRAEIVVMDGFSAHADQRDLLDFVAQAAQTGGLENVALVHGEPPAQRALAERLAQSIGARVICPQRGDRLAV